MSSAARGCLVVPRTGDRGSGRMCPGLMPSGVERRADPEPEELTPRAASFLRSSIDPWSIRSSAMSSAAIVARVVDAAVRRLVGRCSVFTWFFFRTSTGSSSSSAATMSTIRSWPTSAACASSAVGRDGRLVRADLGEVDPDVPRRASQGDLGPDDAAERLVAREGAAVVERPHLEEAGHRPVGHDADLRRPGRALVPVRVRGVLIRAPFGPLRGRPSFLAIRLRARRTADAGRSCSRSRRRCPA